MILNKNKDKIPKEAIYIGRGSKWGNPFIIGRDGNRKEVCDKYNNYLKYCIRKNIFKIEELALMYKKDLVCFCAPEQCHGDSLEKAINWAYKKINEWKKNTTYK